jgi:hypothetical protein
MKIEGNVYYPDFTSKKGRAVEIKKTGRESADISDAIKSNLENETGALLARFENEFLITLPETLSNVQQMIIDRKNIAENKKTETFSTDAEIDETLEFVHTDYLQKIEHWKKELAAIKRRILANEAHANKENELQGHLLQLQDLRFFEYMKDESELAEALQSFIEEYGIKAGSKNGIPVLENNRILPEIIVEGCGKILDEFDLILSRDLPEILRYAHSLQRRWERMEAGDNISDDEKNEAKAKFAELKNDFMESIDKFYNDHLLLIKGKIEGMKNVDALQERLKKAIFQTADLEFFNYAQTEKELVREIEAFLVEYKIGERK